MLARPMRGLGPIVLVAVLLGAVVTLFVLGAFGGGGEPGPAPAPAPGGPNAPAPTPDLRATGAGARTSGAGGSRLVATRTEAVPPPNKNLADAPTAYLRVIDHATERPIAGAPIRTVQGGLEIAFTDDQGLAPMALREPEQLAVVVPDHLLRLVPARLGSTEAEPQVVRVVRDEWSIVRSFELVAEGGERIETAFVRFRPRGAQPTPKVPVPPTDPVVVRAWTEHGMLAARPVCADVPVQLGVWAEDRVHQLVNGTAVRFLAPGEFTVEAATPDGLVATANVRVEAQPRTGAPAVRLQLVPGAFVSGTALDLANGAPVGGAEITLQGGEPLGLVATTAADGTFRFGPLQPGQATLHVRHAEHEALAFGPLRVPAADARVMLRRLPATTLRGRVRVRSSGGPVDGATVQWTPPGGAPQTARTGPDGTFAVRATGTGDGRLAVTAPGLVPYAELTSPGAPFLEIELWPGSATARIAGGLTAAFDGVVVDAQGQPVANAEVRWQPAAPATGPANVPQRRVLEGASLELPIGTRTRADGTFLLETNHFGPGRLVLAADPSIGADTTAVAGQTQDGFRLQR